MVAAVIVMMANLDAVPANIPHWDFLIPILTFTAGSLAYKVQLNPVGGVVLKPQAESWFDPQNKKELERKRDLLPGVKSSPGQKALETLTFILLAAPIGLAVWEWLSNDPAVAEIDTLQLGANAGALATLAPL